MGRDPKTGKAGRPSRVEEYTPAGSPGDDPLTRSLKKVYAEVAAEPVPEHLLELLNRLDGKTIDKKKGGGNG